MTDWNANTIEEFRANDGKVGGVFEGASLLLLHSTGAKTGKERVTPMMYQAVDGGYAVFASKAGAHSHPDWYYNLVANPKASAEVGTETIDVTARITDDDERHGIWHQQKSDYPQFGEYEAKTTRQIPVVILETAS